MSAGNTPLDRRSRFSLRAERAGRYRCFAGIALVAVLAACGSERAAPPVPCEVVGDAPAADQALARAGCEGARARFTELFGVPAPAVRIRLSERAGFGADEERGQWTFRWPTTSTLTGVGRQLGVSTWDTALGRPRGEWMADQWEQLMPHEIGHLLLIAAVENPDRPGEAGQYGSSLPDWFDESVAIWMEPREKRDARLARVMGADSKPPMIATLLRREHPSAGSVFRGWRSSLTTQSTYGPCRGVCPARDTRARTITATVDTLGRSTVDTTYAEAGSKRAVPTADSFYAPALAALLYLRERGGAPAILALRERLRADPEATAPLAGFPGIPNDSAALQADWEAWWESTSHALAPPPESPAKQ